MGNSLLRLSLPLIFFLASLFPLPCQSQIPRKNISSITGYTCPNQSYRQPCQTMAFYRAQSPRFANLSSISDLFGVSMLSIKLASNLSSETASLADGQKLLIPINCDCMGNLSQANITYQIKGGDTFYLVSTFSFGNLTTYQAVEVANPALIPTQLDIGVMVVFPIRCRCPTPSQRRRGLNFLITYVVEVGDTLVSIATMFNSSVHDITLVNDVSTLVPYDTILVPVSQFPQFTQPTSPSTAETPSPSSLPQIPTGNSSSKGDRGLIIVLSVLLGACSILFVLFLVLFRVLWVRRKNTEEPKIEKKGSVAFSSYAEDGRAYSSAGHRLKTAVSDRDFLADISQCLDKYNLYSLQDLRSATNDFHPNYLIQGHVYKVTIGEEAFAVKKMKSDVSEELRILQKVNHSNLVRLDGFCIDASEGECYLVYEYVENGSLYSWLKTRKPLNWKTRVQIAVDVANGLNYIHEHTQPSVVHKDVKSGNILLDRNMRGKIANFGLAKSGCNAITRHIVGTQGYMAPEYLLDGVVTTKMDVFAFGVVLLELVSGRLAVGEGGKLLWMEIQGLLDVDGDDREAMVRRWLDDSLMESGAFSMKSVMSVVTIAVACLRKEASARPHMGDIVYMLSKAEELCLDSP
ncbi:unnamed protein product [Victoria cruziana]